MKEECKQPQDIILPNDMRLVVSSYGGAASTMLMTHIYRFKNINQAGDRDGLKHSSLPPVTLGKNIRFLYIYGDPVNAVISLFRRNFHHDHSAKLQKRLTRKPNPIPLEMTVDEYACQGEDRFYFKEHFLNWYDKCLVHPTLFVRYESLYDHLEEIQDFFELPKAFVDEFPEKKERQSVVDSVSKTTLTHLKHTYRDLQAILDELDDVVTVSRPGSMQQLRVYSSSTYRKIIMNNLEFFAREYTPNYYHRYTSLRGMFSQ